MNFMFAWQEQYREQYPSCVPTLMGYSPLYSCDSPAWSETQTNVFTIEKEITIYGTALLRFDI